MCVVNPGDTLILFYEKTFPDGEKKSRITRGVVQEHLPEVDVVLFAGVKQAMVYKPGKTSSSKES